MWKNLKPSQLINSNRAAFWIPGFAIAVWGPFIPYIKERFALTEDHLGLLLMCLAVGAISALSYASFALSRLGCRTLVRIGTVIITICLGAVTVITDFTLLCVVLFIMGSSSECMAMAANVNAATLEKVLNRNIMSGLHGVYSLGNAVGVFMVATFLGTGMTFMMGNLLLTASILPLIIILYCGLIGSRYMLTDLKEAQNEEEHDREQDNTANKGSNGKVKKVFMTPMVLILGTICFIMFLVEGSMLDWTGVFLNEVKGVPLHEAGYGFAAFATMMTICRLTGDKIVSTLGRKRVLTGGAVFAFAGIVLAVTVPHPMVTIIGFGMVGVGASNLVPQAVSYAATIREMPLQRSILMVNAIGYIGSLFGPALIGFIAHRIGLEKTFLFLATLVLIVAILAYTKIRSGTITDLLAADKATAASAPARADAAAAAPSPATTSEQQSQPEQAVPPKQSEQEQQAHTAQEQAQPELQEQQVQPENQAK